MSAAPKSAKSAKSQKAAAAPALPPNAFIGWTAAPTDAEVAAALGPIKPLWDAIAIDLAESLGLSVREWKSYSSKYGWALQLRRGKRNIVHLAPCQGCVRALLILGERAVAAARAANLGKAATRLLDEAPRYPEGTGLRFEIRRAADLPLLRKLAKIKLDN